VVSFRLCFEFDLDLPDNEMTERWRSAWGGHGAQLSWFQRISRQGTKECLRWESQRRQWSGSGHVDRYHSGEWYVRYPGTGCARASTSYSSLRTSNIIQMGELLWFSGLFRCLCSASTTLLERFPRTAGIRSAIRGTNTPIYQVMCTSRQSVSIQQIL